MSQADLDRKAVNDLFDRMAAEKRSKAVASLADALEFAASHPNDPDAKRLIAAIARLLPHHE